MWRVITSGKVSFPAFRLFLFAVTTAPRNFPSRSPTISPDTDLPSLWLCFNDSCLHVAWERPFVLLEPATIRSNHASRPPSRRKVPSTSVHQYGGHSGMHSSSRKMQSRAPS